VAAPRSAAQEVAAVLRERILGGQVSPGDLLGSEPGLLADLGVSRPTLRQAARILEHEQLVVVKRGKSGGLFARLPTSDAVAHVASVVLRSQGATLDDLVRANGLVTAEAARLAASNAPAADRVALTALVASLPLRGRAVVEGAVELNRRIGTMSGSPTLALFAAMLAELAQATFGVGLFGGGRVKTESTRSYIERLTDALAAGDGDRAALTVREHHEALLASMHVRRTPDVLRGVT
jgi:DNA-binding FadR family transcriptional regulator